MPDLNFAIEGAQPLRFAAAPHISFKLLVTEPTGVNIHTVILQCQVHLDVIRRRYTADEQGRLIDLFGEPSQWNQTLHRMLWANANLVVPAFSGSTVTSLQVPCTFDFNVGVTKYFEGLDEGHIPVRFYFSGTIFFATASEGLQVEKISWEKEASYEMPLQVWRDMMNAYYPNTAWLCLRRDAFDKLNAYKRRHGIPTFEQALESVVP
jgi:Family of unknown function (DUF6084)